MIRALSTLVAMLAFTLIAQAASYDDPWSPATEQAAEAAAAALGANAAKSISVEVRDIVAQTREVAGLTGTVGGGTREIQAKVMDLASAKRDLAAQETDLEVRVELPADVLFDFDKADIRADAECARAARDSHSRVQGFGAA